MEVFENQEFGSIRLLQEAGKTFFCASDVAKALGYVNPYAAVKRHCRGPLTKRKGLFYCPGLLRQKWKAAGGKAGFVRAVQDAAAGHDRLPDRKAECGQDFGAGGPGTGAKATRLADTIKGRLRWVCFPFSLPLFLLFWE